MTSQALGAKIKALREQRRWSQERLADELDVSTKTVGNWESGRSHPRSSMGALNKLFKVDLEAASLEAGGDEVVRALRRSSLIGWRRTQVISEYERHLHEQQREDQQDVTARVRDRLVKNLSGHKPDSSDESQRAAGGSP